MKSLSLAFVVVIGLALTGCNWSPLHRMYCATAEIQILPTGPVVISGPIYRAPDVEPDNWLELETQVIQAPDIMMDVVKSLKLDPIWTKRFQAEHPLWDSKDSINHLYKVVRVQSVRQTDLVEITAYSEIPQEAADIANAVVDTYKANHDKEEVKRHEPGIDALQDQITSQQKAVADARAADHDADSHRRLEQQQSRLEALYMRKEILTSDTDPQESPVRIISRAVAPPE